MTTIQHRLLPVLVTALLLTSVFAGIVAAESSNSSTDENGLSENESVTLWSRDVDSQTTHAVERGQNASTPTITQQYANKTDITFKRPPETAERWTRNDFADLEAGRVDTSLYPTHAGLKNKRFIKDAHATIFGIHPSTRGHLSANDTPLYIPPNSTIRGFVDYRVRVPSPSDDSPTRWTLLSHEIEEVRLIEDGDTYTESDGSHTPTINYHVRNVRSVTLTLEAEISARLLQTTRTETRQFTETVNVSQTIDVETYELSARSHYAEYPNGDTGVAVFQTQPWQGYILTEEGNTTVRGVWRFYTARHTGWDTLVKSNRSVKTRAPSDAIPVYVHAYPSRIGPRTEPLRNGPQMVKTWGVERSSPASTIDDNVNIEIIEQPYSATRGMAVRTSAVDPEALRVTGIVQGVSASPNGSRGGVKHYIRRSKLTIDILEQSPSEATFRISLRDYQTGAPITLDDNATRSSPSKENGSGYISIGGQRVETDATGVATVTVSQPGSYTARYHPGSWVEHEQAYVGEEATVHWHPLSTLEGWLSLLFTTGKYLIPFLLILYTGQRLVRLQDFWRFSR